MLRHTSGQTRPKEKLEFGRFEKTCLAISAAVALGGGGFIVATEAKYNPEAFKDIAHATFGTEDNREKKIRTALGEALGLDVSIRCAPTWKEKGDVITVGVHPELFGVELDILRLHDDICYDATQNINSRPDDFDNPSIFRRVLAAMTITHEAAHALYDDDEGVNGESITECRTAQLMPDVARALGANETTVAEMTKHISSAIESSTERYLPPRDCIDGGPWDVHPDQVGGTFPTVWRRS